MFLVLIHEDDFNLMSEKNLTYQRRSCDRTLERLCQPTRQLPMCMKEMDDLGLTLHNYIWRHLTALNNQEVSQLELYICPLLNN